MIERVSLLAWTLTYTTMIIGVVYQMAYYIGTFLIPWLRCIYKTPKSYHQDNQLLSRLRAPEISTCAMENDLMLRCTQHQHVLFSKIHPDVGRLIGEYWHTQDLCAVKQVCHAWNSSSGCSYLWFKLYRDTYGPLASIASLNSAPDFQQLYRDRVEYDRAAKRILVYEKRKLLPFPKFSSIVAYALACVLLTNRSSALFPLSIIVLIRTGPIIPCTGPIIPCSAGVASVIMIYEAFDFKLMIMLGPLVRCCIRFILWGYLSGLIFIAQLDKMPVFVLLRDLIAPAFLVIAFEIVLANLDF